MGNELMIFEGNEVEVFEFEGKVLFNPYHVGKCLELSDSAVKMAVKGMSEKQVIKLTNSKVNSIDFRKLHNTGENFLTESGVYKLIFKSRKENAEKFQDWVTDEVLPSIRKHGAYMTESTIEKALNSPDFLIQLATKLKEEQEARKALEVKVEEQKPLVEFANRVGNSSDCIDIGEMAKLIKNEDINIGRNRLFQWLRDSKILMSNNLPYQTYIDRGYFEVVEVVKNTPYGDKIFTKTLVTGKGQIWIVEKLKDELNNDELMEA